MDRGRPPANTRPITSSAKKAFWRQTPPFLPHFPKTNPFFFHHHSRGSEFESRGGRPRFVVILVRVSRGSWTHEFGCRGEMEAARSLGRMASELAGPHLPIDVAFAIAAVLCVTSYSTRLLKVFALGAGGLMLLPALVLVLWVLCLV